jgi:3-keto-5-aminohexanoate cleavage enzyme
MSPGTDPSATPCVVEVALNGTTRPERNPHVPLDPADIVADALACIEAGASIVHAHNGVARLPADEAAALYLEAFEPILAARPDALVYPTIGSGADMAGKLAHIERIAARIPLRIGILDPGTMILGWADATGLPDPASFVYVNTYADMEVAIEQCARLRLGPSLAIYEPGFLRNVLAYWRTGHLPRGAMVKLYFGGPSGYFARGEGVTFGLPPTETALDAYLEMLALERCDLPWSAAVMGGDLVRTPLARAVVERGGHLHVGLEDHHGDRTPTNVELVAEVVALCEEVGRPVATCGEAAAVLDLPAPAGG